MFWDNSIANRVAKAIKQRVVDAQTMHDAMVVALEEEKKKAIEAHAEAMVEKIVGKI